MLHLLIEYGANPNSRNRRSHSLVHVASDLGCLDMLSALYDIGDADLELCTDDGLTPLDLASGVRPAETVANESRKYRTWRLGKEDFHQISVIIEGRKGCYQFLQLNIIRDRRAKIDQETVSTRDWMERRSLLRRYFSGLNDEFVVTYSMGMDYPQVEGVDSMSLEEQAHFDKYRIGVHIAAQNMSTKDFVYNSLDVGRDRALRHELRSEQVQQLFAAKK